MYNPLLNKTPYGASVANKATTMTFPLPCSLCIKRVFVVLRKVYGEPYEGELRYELPYRETKGVEDIFAGAFSIGSCGVWNYRFEGEFQDGTLAFFGRQPNGDAVRGDWLPEWQLTVSKTEVKTPNWSKSGVIYHIFADRFCKGEDRPFLKNGRLHKEWSDTPDIQKDGEDYKADDFFGGNIAGILSKLDYIKSLGVSCIYLSPIFKSSSNHRYDTGDYLQIDELFGDEAQFATLIKESKARGIHVMLDGVFNHTGANSLYFNREGEYDSLGAYQSKQSPYYGWYYFDEYPSVYKCWWGSTVVPTVNKSAQGFRNLMLGDGGVIDKWTSMGVDGWRLDVVDELPIEFTTEICQKVRKYDIKSTAANSNDAYFNAANSNNKNAKDINYNVVNSNFASDKFIVGEVWEDASVKISYGEWRPYLMGEQLHSVMNYPFKEAILSYTLNGDKDAFVEKVERILENYPKEVLHSLMNLIDSHDTVRALTALSGVPAPESKAERAKFLLDKDAYELAKNRLKIASTIQYLLPGVPCLYYGDEAGMQGFEDPLNRGTYPWGNEDKDLVSHYIVLGEFRKKYAERLLGDMHFVADDRLLIFEIVSEKGILRVESDSQNIQASINGEIILKI